MELYRNGIKDELSLLDVLAWLNSRKNDAIKSVKISWVCCNHPVRCYKLVLVPLWDTKTAVQNRILPCLELGWIGVDIPMAFERIRKAGQEVYHRLRYEMPGLSYVRDLAYPKNEGCKASALAAMSDAELRKMCYLILPGGKKTQKARRAARVLQERREHRAG